MRNLYRPNRRGDQQVRRRESAGRRGFHRLRPFLSGLAALSALLGACYVAGSYALPRVEGALKSTGLFALRQVQVEGVRNLTEAQVVEKSGLVLGENILATDLEAVRRRLLAHPLVRNAAVRRFLPADIVVEVEERVPAVEVRGASRFIVDAEGYLMTVAPENLPVSLPCLTGLEVEGDRVSPGDLDDLRDGLDIVWTMAAAGFPPRGSVECIDLGDEGDAVIVQAGGGPLVHLGRTGVAERLRRWSLVSADIASRWAGVEYIDLRAEGLVVTRPLPPRPETAEGGGEG